MIAFSSTKRNQNQPQQRSQTSLVIAFLGSDPSGSLTSDPARQLHVLRHDRHAFGVNGAQVGVIEQSHQVKLRRLLERQERRTCESKIGFEVLRDLSHKPLERQAAYQFGGMFLKMPDLP
jgi:hypothetical protein